MERLMGKFQLSFLTIFLLAMNVSAGGAIAGKVTILKGQVFIQRGSQKIQVKKDDTVLESDIIESEAGTARITMIDSNLVDVYPRSKVEIAKYVYKPNQDQKEVELKIDFGKIKSTVNQKYDGAKNKFQVKTPSAVAGVRGTVFTAEYDRIKKVSRVVTIEGLVAVSKMLDRERQSPPVFVRPDQVVKVDIEQSKAEQPRDLMPEEREVHQQEDKDLGYQYDPKQDPSTEQLPTGAIETPKEIHEPIKKFKEIAASEPIKEIKKAKEFKKFKKIAASEPIKEIKPTKEFKEIKKAKEIAVGEPIKEIKPTKEFKEIVVRAPIKEIKETVTTAISNSNARQQQQQQEQERRQKNSEEEQSRKQKQLEDEQTKKQKQSEDGQTKKQKQLEEEQSKRIQEDAQKRAESARRLAEVAKRAGTLIRPPSGSETPTTSPRITSPTKN